MHGRYPDYNVLDEADHWDEVTRRLVLERVDDVPPIRFFTATEAATLGVFCDLVMAQDREPRIPVLNMVDAKLFAGELDGFRYADMPDDRETWRRVALGLDAAARQHGARGLRRRLGRRAARGRRRASPTASCTARCGTSCRRATTWKVVTRAILSAFYSHPWAWNEIGFGGPAYPRGYARLGRRAARELGGRRGVRARPGQGHRGRGVAGRMSRAPRAAHARCAARCARPRTTRRSCSTSTAARSRRERMARYDDSFAVDLVIVGAGAGGGTLAQRLARRGWKVVVLESGPFWDPDADWVSDEAGSHRLYWTEERIIGGSDPVELGKNNSGHGVGGSMVHYAGYCPRFHPSDFEVRTRDGVGEDWPISYEDLKPHYERLELELPVAGRVLAVGRSAPLPARPASDRRRRRARAGGARASSGSRCASARSGSPTARSATGRTASTAAICLQGCKVNAKASPLVTHIPDAIEHGVEIRADCMVTRDRGRRRRAGASPA